jgi:hypothetical protein
MQEKSEKFLEYSERTEVLAKLLHLNLSELPEKMGLSSSMFHAYRSGKYPISPKAWRKVEAAERAAGIGSAAAAASGENAESESKVKDAEAEYGKKPEVDLPWQVGLVAAMTRIAAALEGIEKKMKDSN